MKKYEKYKDSGVEWLGEIPEHWTVKCIKHTYTVNMGQSPDSSNCNNEGIGIPFLQGNAAFGSINPIPESWCTELNKKSDINDILVSVRAPIGAVNISDQEYGIGRGLCAISGEVYKYIYYLFITLSEELNAHGTGSTFKAISVEQLKNINIPVPSNFEQQVISQYLEYTINEIETLIQEKSAFINKLQEKRKALINEVVTKGLNPNAPMRDSGIEWLGMIPKHWKLSKMKFIGTVKGRIGFKGYSVTDLVDSSTPNRAIVLGGTNVMKSGFISYEKLTFLSYEKYEESPEIMLKGGEILITKVGAGVGENAIYTYYEDKVTINPNVMLLVVDNDSMDEKFVNYFLLSDTIKSQIHIESQKSGAQPAINQSFIKNLPIFVPNKIEQSEIVQFIESRTTKIVATIGEIQLQLQKLKEYKAAVISEVVTGKVDVREWKTPNQT